MRRRYKDCSVVFTAVSLLALLLEPQEGLAACGVPGLSNGTFTMSNQGISRTFRVQLPAGYNVNVPSKLILAFHGWGGDENEFLSNSTVAGEASARGYVVVAPRGLGSGAPDFSYNSWTFRGSATGLDGDGLNPTVSGDTDAICDNVLTPDYAYPSCANTAANTCSWTHCQTDDVAFVLALVDHLKANLCIDSTNIFATGGSNGGMFVWELGQNSRTATTFRAIAPLVGLPHRAYLSGKGTSGALPALLITGTLDKTVPPGAWNDASFTTTSNGSDRYYYTGATAITKVWATAHGCSTTGTAVAFNDGYTKTDCRTYCSSDSGWPRVLDCRLRMGHTYSFGATWPLILDFFDRHSG